MKKLLITGSYGLIGTEICNQLARNYPDIEITKVKFDELPQGSFDYIIHGAGYGQPARFISDGWSTIKVNTQTTKELLERLNTDGSFLYISTSEVYSGHLSPHIEEMIGTTTPQHPRACYIEAKRCGEAICSAYRKNYDVKIARLALAYGPGTKKGDTRVINQFIEQSLNRDIILKDDGSAIRTYIYVSDAVEMMLNILFKGTQDVYNVGGDSETTIKDLAMTIARKQGYGIVVGKVDKPLVGAPESVKLDISRYENEFGKMKFISLSEGLYKTIEYQKQLYK